MYRFGVIGDDLRMKYLFGAFKKDGYSVRIGTDEGVRAVIDDSDIIILPINRHGLLAMCKNKTVLGGFTNPFVIPEGAVVYNYLENPVFTAKNALATAEGAISVAMQSTDDILAFKNVVVCGFGNIGKILCQKLLLLGCNVTVCARRTLSRAEAENMGAHACSFGALGLATPSVIFNTVPAPVLTSDILSSLNEDTIIIELASKPGGIDLEYAHAHGITVIDAQALPAKYSPRFAGQILKETVISILEEG